MNFSQMLIIAFAVSMDAFAIAVCKGLAVEKLEKRHMLLAGLWFGSAQALMPLAGYFLGSSFHSLVSIIDHWISFALLLIIGIGMIREATEESEHCDASFAAAAMFPLAIADSIDAMAVGVTFAFDGTAIVPAVTLIGITTFLFSSLGVKIGSVFGLRYKSRAEIAGGVTLIIMGILTLVQELGLL